MVTYSSVTRGSMAQRRSGGNDAAVGRVMYRPYSGQVGPVAVNYTHGVVRSCAFHQPATAVDSNARSVARYGVISHPQRARR